MSVDENPATFLVKFQRAPRIQPGLKLFVKRMDSASMAGSMIPSHQPAATGDILQGATFHILCRMAWSGGPLAISLHPTSVPVSRYFLSRLTLRSAPG
jgi:hypothetical protein